MGFIPILHVFLSYICGAIPFGYLLTKSSTGLNILELGSCNIGSTNVGRIAGKVVALKVQLLDMLKGFLPVGVVLLASKSGIIGIPDYYIFIIAFSTIIGHTFSIFLSFRGGKGVNTTLGATILLAPLEVFCSVALYFSVKWCYKYVSASSMALAFALPVFGFIFREDSLLITYLILCCFLILLRHLPNIKRLISGNELR